MFAPQIAALRLTLRANARRAAWSALGGILILVGLIFFGIAIFVVLEYVLGLLGALVIMGLVFVLLGALTRAWSRYPPPVAPRYPAADPMRPAADPLRDPMYSPPLSAASLINAIVMGIAAGRAMRRR